MKKTIYSSATLLMLLIVSFMGLSAQPVPPTIGGDDLPVGGVPDLRATVTTEAVTNISHTIATGNGNITDLGLTNTTAHGICWNTTGTPTIADGVVDNGPASATGSFTGAISSLAAGTLYYVRAYATNSAGTNYGSEVSFLTIDASISIPTLLLQESFEGTTNYTANQFSTGSGDFSSLYSLSPGGFTPIIDVAHGTDMWVMEDVDNAAANPLQPSSDCAYLIFSTQDVSAYDTVQVTLILMSDSARDYEKTDSLVINYAFDADTAKSGVDSLISGNYTTIGAFRGAANGRYSSHFTEDVDLDGIQNDNTPYLNHIGQEFTYKVATNGASKVSIQILVSIDGGEEVAIDNVRIYGLGEASPPEAPVISDVYPANGDTLYVDSIYTILATVTTEDAEGIDSVKIIFGPSPTMMFEESSLYNEVDTFSNFFSMGEAGTYYGQILAYGGNGEITLGDTIEVTAISLAPQIIKSYPSQDTIFTVGDSLKIGIIATVAEGNIDTVLILLSMDGINPMMAQELLLVGDDFYGIYGIATQPQTIYIAFAVVANGDTAMTDFFLFHTQCGEIDTVTALAADEITDVEFTAIWTSSDEASHYSLNIWTVADGDTSYTVKDQSISDTTYTATNLDENTMYYYNVKVVTGDGCESNNSNTVSVKTAVATGLNETISLPSVSTQTNQIKVSTTSKANVKVYHISGTLITSELLVSDKTFDVNSGIYLVKVDNHIHKVIVP